MVSIQARIAAHGTPAMSALSASLDTPIRSAAVGSAQGFATNTPKMILRLEGGAVLAASVAGYAALGGGWGMFALLFLAPDLSMLGYLGGPRLGAAAYNFGHSYLSPAILAACGVGLTQPQLLPLALIWCAHIGFDRLLGYGLKYADAFGHTHLGLTGKTRA